jgi:hypothetical protein
VSAWGDRLWPVADAMVVGPSVRNWSKFRHQLASPVDSGRRCNRRPHPATASEESCRRRGHGSSSARDPELPFFPETGCKLHKSQFARITSRLSSAMSFQKCGLSAVGTAAFPLTL